MDRRARFGSVGWDQLMVGLNGFDRLMVDRRAPVMIFFEWVCSGGFQFGWVWLGRGRGRGLLWSCLGFKSAPVMIFFLSAWVCV